MFFRYDGRFCKENSEYWAYKCWNWNYRQTTKDRFFYNLPPRFLFSWSLLVLPCQKNLFKYACRLSQDVSTLVLSVCINYLWWWSQWFLFWLFSHCCLIVVLILSNPCILISKKINIVIHFFLVFYDCSIHFIHFLSNFW